MAINVAAMDKISGLSKDKFSAMDKIAGGTQQQPQTPEDKLTGATKMLTGIGQNVGGFAKDIGLGGAVDLVAHSGPAQAVQNATGVNPLLNSQTLQQESQQPVQNALGDVGSAALDLGGGELLGLASKGISKVAKGAGYALKHPTMGSAVKAQAASVAGDAIHDITPAIQNSLKEAVTGKNEFNANVAKEVQNIWDTKLAAPLTHEELALRTSLGKKSAVSGANLSKLTAEQLLHLRQSVGNKAAFGSNAYSDGAQANKIVYRAINEMLKGKGGVAPGLKSADKLISTYSNPYFTQGPHIPFTGIKIPYSNNMQGLPAGAINTLIAALGGEELLKHGGL